MIKVLFLNQTGDGFGSEFEIAENTRLDDFLRTKFGENFNSAAYKIRVNREIRTPGYILQNNDRVTATLMNQKGA